MRAVPSPAEVEAYLHRHIPLSADMGVAVVACEDAGVTLRAPLAPNINHRATVFGGSVSAVTILAAWTWLHFSLRAAGHTSRLVIQRNTNVL
jgi:thioesterase domain-containing protein